MQNRQVRPGPGGAVGWSIPGGPKLFRALRRAIALATEYNAAGPGCRRLDADTLARRRRVQGEDHPDTMFPASNLAADLRALGAHQAAQELDTDTLARRRVLGEDHPDTQRPAHTLQQTCVRWDT